MKMEDWVGFRLCPTEDEMVGCLLYYKLMQRALLANNFINEVNIYNYDPWDLPLESKLKSRDSLWYFFTPVISGDRQSRSTSSGFWKITGEAKQVHDRWGSWSGKRGEKIGFKRVLRFHIGKIPNKGNGDWIIHEYHNTMLPENLRTHVMCRMEYKGDDIRFISDVNETEMITTPALVQELSNNSTAGYVEQVPVPVLNGNEMQTVWNYVNEEDFRSEYDDLMVLGDPPSLVDSCWYMNEGEIGLGMENVGGILPQDNGDIQNGS